MRLKREGGAERITFELVGIKAITMEPGMLDTEGTGER
jgi:hypothetical protein